MDKVDGKLQFGLLGRRYFITVIAGRDLRTQTQGVLADRRAIGPSVIKTFLLASALLWLLIAGVLFTGAVLYLLKSYLGIDLVQGSSPVPQFLHWIRLCHAV